MSFQYLQSNMQNNVRTWLRPVTVYLFQRLRLLASNQNHQHKQDSSEFVKVDLYTRNRSYIIIISIIIILI